MDPTDNPFVKRRLETLSAIEREIIRLYAESCYSTIQAVHGNRSCVSRADELNRALISATERLRTVKTELRRLGLTAEAMLSLDDLQRLELFEDQLGRHDPAFVCRCQAPGFDELAVLLADAEMPD